jgi:mannose-6-phosphate isomerase-like protein (cupin superfamily)
MDEKAYGFFDLTQIKSGFPDHAESLIVDAYLSDHESASSRLFRLYHPIPRHFHETCDEHLVLLDGEVDFTIADEPPRRLRAGQMVTFLRNIVHGIRPVEGAAPAIFFTVDTPRRAPGDVHFVDPAEAKGRRFVTHLANYEARSE